MKKYEHPQLIITEFDLKDIITASSADIDGGNTQFPGSWIEPDIDGEESEFKEEWPW